MSDLAARDRVVFWHPCGQMRDYDTLAPLEIVGATGAALICADGRRVWDPIASWWCKSVGHGHPRVRAAVARQLESFEHVITANTTYDALVRLCERLVAVANGLPPSAWGPAAPVGRRPGQLGKVFFADNGSTGVEVALKMALQAQAHRGETRRTHFMAFENGYHGDTVGALSVGDLGLYADPFRPLLRPAAKLRGLPYRTGPDDSRWDDASAEWPAIERALDAQAHELCAVVYEPVLQAAGGMKLYSPDLLRRLRRWAGERGVFLIADEIASGFGRCGPMLASHLAGEGAGADFVVVSKGLTGGVVPFSAVITTDEIYALFEGDEVAGRAFLHANTFAGNALGVAAANAVLDIFADEDVPGQAARTGPHLREALRRLARSRRFLSGVRGCGMMAAVDLRAPDGGPLAARARTGYRVFQQAVRRGALFRPLGDTIYFFPPLTTSAAEIDAMAAILEESVDAVLADGGRLP